MSLHTPVARLAGTFLAAFLLAASPAAAERTPEGLVSAAEAQVEAEREGHRVAVTQAGSPLRRVYANPNGSFTAELFAEPVQVRRGGGWVPVDTTLERAADGTVRPRAVAASVAFSGGGDEPLARIAGDGQSVELDWPGALPEPRLEGDTATYRDVRPGVDLELRATPQGFAPRFIVKRRSARAGTLTLEREIKAGGRPLAFASGEAAVRAQDGELGDVAVKTAADGVALVPDAELLAGGAYPLAVVAPQYDRHVWESGWAKVFSGHPNQSYWLGGGDDGIAKIGYCGWAGCGSIATARSYFQYDHQGFLFGKNILYAEFNARMSYAPSCGEKRWMDVWATEAIHGGTNWNNQPWHGRAFAGNYHGSDGYSASCPPRRLGWDVTASVRNRVAAWRNDITYALSAGSGSEGDRFAWRKFDWNPSLIVQYNTPPSQPDGESADDKACAIEPHEPHTTDATPTLRARVQDPDGGHVRAHFEWWVRFGHKVGETVTGERSSGAEHSVDIPDGAFQDGARIAYRVRGFDGRDWGPFGRWCDVTVDTTEPAQPPVVTSSDYVELDDEGNGEQSGAPGQTGWFRFSAGEGDDDVTRFRYSIVNSPPDKEVAAPDGEVAVPVTPPTSGPKTLHVQSLDKAGNPGPIYHYDFMVRTATPPQGHWRLDGRHADMSAPDAIGDRDGTLQGGRWVDGRVRDAVTLNGSTGHVSTTGGPPIDTSNSFTVSAWVKPEWSLQGGLTAVSIDGDRASGFFLRWIPMWGQWQFMLPHGDRDSAAESSVSAPAVDVIGRWTHLAGVFDVAAREVRIYVDGQLAGTAPYHGSPWRAGGNLQIGRAKWNGVDFDRFPGALDDVKVWQRALPADELAPLALRPTHEEGRWMFDAADGRDSSGSLRPVTLAGGAAIGEGRRGGGVALDGSDDSAATTGPVLRTDRSYTVSAWVRLDRKDPGLARTAISQDGQEKSAFLLGYRGDSGRWSMLVTNTDVGYDQHAVAAAGGASNAPVEGQWTHLTAVQDMAARELRIYVAGRQAGEARFMPNFRPWHGSGPLRIGRAKWAGGATDNWPGAIDDVRVFTGVRTQSEIFAEASRPGPAAASPFAGSIGRYGNHSSDHLTASGPVPAGYRYEGGLGLPALPGAENTRTLYACRFNDDTFTSSQPDCEGYPRLETIGEVYADPPAGVPTRPLYRCRITQSGEHFESVIAGCEGQSVEWTLGHVRAFAPLVTHRETDGGERRTTTAETSAAFVPERRLGDVELGGGEGRQALYACRSGDEHFSSLDSRCEGRTVTQLLGYTWAEPPPEGDGVPVYACRGEDGERFDSASEGCEGGTQDAFLGYVRAPS